MFSKDRNGFFSRQDIFGNNFLPVINSQIKNQDKLPTGSCVSCNIFLTPGWVSQRNLCLMPFDAVLYLMLFLCLTCFDISAQIPGYFLFIFWIMLTFQRKIPKNWWKYNFTMFHYLWIKICHWILMHIFQILFTPTNEKLFQVKTGLGKMLRRNNF